MCVGVVWCAVGETQSIESDRGSRRAQTHSRRVSAVTVAAFKFWRALWMRAATARAHTTSARQSQISRPRPINSTSQTARAAGGGGGGGPNETPSVAYTPPSSSLCSATSAAVYISQQQQPAARPPQPHGTCFLVRLRDQSSLNALPGSSPLTLMARSNTTPNHRHPPPRPRHQPRRSRSSSRRTGEGRTAAAATRRTFLRSAKAWWPPHSSSSATRRRATSCVRRKTPGLKWHSIDRSTDDFAPRVSHHSPPLPNQPTDLSIRT